MVKTIIFSDFAPRAQQLDNLISSWCPFIQLAGKAIDSGSARRLLQKTHPDVILLDAKPSSELAHYTYEVTHETDIELFSLTNNKQLGLHALEKGARAFVVKPVQPPKLVRLFAKSYERLKRRVQWSDLNMGIQAKRISLQGKIALPVSSGFSIVKIEEIVRIEADGNYSKFHFTNGQSTLTSRIVGYYEKLLSIHGFFRIHRSHLINISHLLAYSCEDGGYALLTDDCPVPISSRRKEFFLKHLTDREEFLS